jgi:hypothetical protein
MLTSTEDEDLIKIKKIAIEFHTFYYNENVMDKEKKEVLWNFVSILDRLTNLGYDAKILHIHKGWDLVHLFATRKNQQPH